MEEDVKKVKKVSLLLRQSVAFKLFIQRANFWAAPQQKTCVSGILCGDGFVSLTTLDKWDKWSGIMGHNVRTLMDNYHVKHAEPKYVTYWSNRGSSSLSKEKQLSLINKVVL